VTYFSLAIFKRHFQNGTLDIPV